MKGTAMALVGGTVTAASKIACEFAIPFGLIEKARGAAMLPKESFSCDLEENCCHGVQHAEWDFSTATRNNYGDVGPGGKARAAMDMSGTCSRADQVDLYQCAVDNLPTLVPPAFEGKARAMIQSKGCPNVAANLDKFPADEAYKPNQCSLNLGKGKGKDMQMGALSPSCCGAFETTVKAVMSKAASSTWKAKNLHAAECGFIGACGRDDQRILLKLPEVKEDFCRGQGPWCAQSDLELLETINMTTAGAPQMMATFMASLTSEAEDDVIEDDDNEGDATEDGSPIGAGILGFVAGAAVTGLGVAALRRRTPSSQNEYNEIVA